jgi:hypothetical protein
MLHGMGIPVAPNLEKLIDIKSWLETKLDRELPSRVGKAGIPKGFD